MLIELGALDVEPIPEGLAAIMPDSVPAQAIADALGVSAIDLSDAVGRDDGSVWRLAPHPVRVRTLEIVPAGTSAPPGAITLLDGPAFGTGLHPTTALCLEAIEDLLDGGRPSRVLDVGTGSAILALAALRLGVSRAVGLDVDGMALRVAVENTRLNGLAGRVVFVRGGPEAVRGTWPLVLANIRAAELMAMAAVIVRRIGTTGHLILSGIPRSVADDVERVYRRTGMTTVRRYVRDGWTALILRASW